MDGDHEMVLAPALGPLVVVLRYQQHHGFHQFAGEGGPVGGGREPYPAVTLIATALTLGGSIRAGVEDNLYLPSGEMARSNGDLIAQARKMTERRGTAPGDGGRGARAARDRVSRNAADT